MSDALPRTITVHECRGCPWTRYELYGEELSAICHHPEILPLAEGATGVESREEPHFPDWCPLPEDVP